MKKEIICKNCGIDIKNAPLKLYGKIDNAIYCAKHFWDIKTKEREITQLKKELKILK